MPPSETEEKPAIGNGRQTAISPRRMEEQRLFTVAPGMIHQMGDTASVSSSGVGMEIQECPGVEMVRLWTWSLVRQWRTKNRSDNLCRGGPESKGYALGLDTWGKPTSELCARWTVNALGPKEGRGEEAGGGCWLSGGWGWLGLCPWPPGTSLPALVDFHAAYTWEHSGAAGTCVSLPTASLSYWNAFTCIHRERKLLGIY